MVSKKIVSRVIFYLYNITEFISYSCCTIGWSIQIQIFGNKLIKTTQVAPLKQELNYQKEKIMQRVNEALKENIVKEVLIQ